MAYAGQLATTNSQGLLLLLGYAYTAPAPPVQGTVVTTSRVGVGIAVTTALTGPALATTIAGVG